MEPPVEEATAPADKERYPPWPLRPDPTVIEIEPPRPRETEDELPILIAPELLLELEPELKTIFPESPENPSAVLKAREPEDDDFPDPELITTEPPRVVDPPADISTEPPIPESPDPTAI